MILLTRMSGTLAAMLIALTLDFVASARGEMVEVAPGISVTKRTYNAPINEQPFFGFRTKTPEERAADEKFAADIFSAAGSREKAFDAAMQRGWMMVSKNNFVDAAKRFNQAFLVSPEQSGIYHSFAVIAVARFNDVELADELFKLALKQPNPMSTLNADYGRFLLIAKRQKEALPVLERSIVDAPRFPDAWSNLALARLENGDKTGACAAVAQADKLKPSINVASDLNIVRRQASCG